MTKDMLGRSLGITDVRSQGKTWILRTPSADGALPNLFQRLKTSDIRRINVQEPNPRPSSST